MVSGQKPLGQKAHTNKSPHGGADKSRHGSLDGEKDNSSTRRALITFPLLRFLYSRLRTKSRVYVEAYTTQCVRDRAHVGHDVGLTISFMQEMWACSCGLLSYMGFCPTSAQRSIE